MDSREENRALKHRLGLQSKELAMIKTHLEMMAHEKKATEEEVGAKDRYLQKLQTKIALGAKDFGLSEKNAVLTGKVTKLRKTLSEMKQIMQEKDEKIVKQESELEILSSALEAKASEEYGIQGDFKSAVLYDVAKYRRMCEELENKLEDMEGRAMQQDEEIQSLRETVDELNFCREDDNTELVKKEKQILKLQESSERRTKSLQTISTDRDSMLQKVEDLSSEISRWERKHQELDHQFAKLQTESKTKEDHLEGEARLRDQEIRRVKEEFSRLATVSDLTSDSLTKERKKTGSLGEESSKLAEELHEMENEVVNLNAELDALRDKDDQLSEEYATLVDEHDSLKEEHDHLSSQFQTLSKEHAQVKQEREQTVIELRDRVRDLETTNERLRKEGHRLEAALHDSVEKCSLAIESREKVDAQMRASKQKSDMLEQSKVLMQRTLLSQIDSLRQEAEEAKEETTKWEKRCLRMESELKKSQITLAVRSTPPSRRSPDVKKERHQSPVRSSPVRSSGLQSHEDAMMEEPVDVEEDGSFRRMRMSLGRESEGDYGDVDDQEEEEEEEEDGMPSLFDLAGSDEY
jgi:chromosome segregation ATPase